MPNKNTTTAREKAGFRLAIGVPTDAVFGRNIMLGAARYAASAHLTTLLLNLTYPPLPNPKRWNADAVIVVLLNKAMVRQVKSWRLPVVNVSTRIDETSFPRVIGDNVAIGRMGANHLLEKGLRNFGYFSLEKHFYSEQRGHAFLACLAEHGYGGSVLKHDPKFLSHKELAQKVNHWLRQSSKPIGIMACNDNWAMVILEQCQRLRLRIPDDVAVVGVDNDEVFCLSFDPPLSSVDINMEHGGYEAARLAHRMLMGEAPPTSPILVPPRGVVVRRSTDIVACEDPLVMQAMQIIRQRASSGFNVNGLLDEMAISRRKLERRFREALGQTPAQEIRKAQLDAAKRLLIDTNLPMDKVAQASGLGYERRLRLLFASQMKTTPLAFRKLFRRNF